MKNIQDKIRTMREIKDWSQEDMAEKMNISVNSYARIERGESKLNLEKLERIASIFKVDIIDLISSNEKNLICLINENSDNSSNYYGNNEKIMLENDMLKLTIKHKDEIILKQENEILALKEIISLLKSNK